MALTLSFWSFGAAKFVEAVRRFQTSKSVIEMPNMTGPRIRPLQIKCPTARNPVRSDFEFGVVDLDQIREAAPVDLDQGAIHMGR
jgi:hypothetical protein